MSDLARTISVELFKLRRRKSTYVVPAVMIAVAVLMVLVLEFAARRNLFGEPSGYFVAAQTIHWIVTFLLMFVAIVTAFVVSQEFALGTVKSAWIRPVRRDQWYTGKIVFAAGVVTDLFLLTALVVVALVAFRLGFDDLVESIVIHTSRSLALHFVLTAALTLWALWSVTAVAGMIATICGNPGVAIAAGLGAGIGMAVLSVIEPLAPFLVTRYATLPLEQMIAMSKGIPLPLEWRDLVTWSLAVPAAWMLVAWLAGRQVIRNKEISD